MAGEQPAVPSVVVNVPPLLGEVWVKRPIGNVSQASYFIGRLLNSFYFYASQAWLLRLAPWSDEGQREQILAVNSLDLIGATVHAGKWGGLWGRALLPLKDYLDTWKSGDLFGEHDWESFAELNHPLDEDRAEVSREDRCQAFRDSSLTLNPEPLRNVLRLCLQEPRSLGLLYLGEQIDQVARPDTVYRDLWDPAKRPVLRPGEKLRTGNRGSQYISYDGADDDGFEFGAVRTLNQLANTSRGAWAVPPVNGWRERIEIGMRQAKLDNVVGPVDDSPRTLEDLDAKIWSALDTSLPQWDPVTRKLSVFGEPVKDFHKQQFGNQERVIKLFHERGWPSEIDNPEPKKTKNTIQGLNDHKTPGLIRFHSSAGGQKISWNFCGDHRGKNEP